MNEIQDTDLAQRKTISEMVDAYLKAVDQIKTAYATLSQVEQDLKTSFCEESIEKERV